MQDDELLSIWKSYDQKMEEVLSINRTLIYELTKGKLNTTINKLRRPKRVLLCMGIPYTLLLYLITLVAYQADAFFVTRGFGAIALIMTTIVILYLYHLYLIDQISNSDDILYVQEKLSSLKLSSFNCARLAVFQLPFWSMCWVSVDALKNSPILYGGVNLAVFLGLTYLSYWLYKRLSIQHADSKVSRFFLSGIEWEPIIQSSNILEQLKEYSEQD